MLIKHSLICLQFYLSSQRMDRNTIGLNAISRRQYGEILAAYSLTTWLAAPVGKRKRIICSDWQPELVRGAHLANSRLHVQIPLEKIAGEQTLK